MKKGKPKRTQWQRVLRTCLSFALILTLALGNIVPLNVAKAEGSSQGAATGGTQASEQNTTLTANSENDEGDPYASDILYVDFDGDWSEFASYLGRGENPTDYVFQVEAPTS